MEATSIAGIVTSAIVMVALLLAPRVRDEKRRKTLYASCSGLMLVVVVLLGIGLL